MALTNSQYDAILRTYADNRNNALKDAEARLSQIYDEIPEYEELDRLIPALSLEAARHKINDEEAGEDLASILDGINKQKQALLAAAGYPADYLLPRFTCKDCQDTGYIDGVRCHCLKHAITGLLYAQSHIETLLLTENFDHLSYLYYQGEELKLFRAAVDTAHHFIDHFDDEYNNILFFGPVGTGKSFLSSCIARELLNLDKVVLYFSASQLFDFLAHKTFDKNDKEGYSNDADDIMGCDLLIIDDLGTELTNSFVQTQLFSCLSARNLARKSTIISTNLSLEEIRNRYTDRVFSRITSQFTLCKLAGTDIRMQRKLQMNRK